MDTRATPQPNILLFLTDDHGAWATGCYGNGEVRTPALDRLATMGTRFANAFTPTPVCSPARACLLTGRTASQVGIHDWLEEAVPAIAERGWLAGESTLFELLGRAGYYTGLCGKWHLGRSHLAPRGADYHFGLPGWQGDHHGAYTYIRNSQPITLNGNKSSIITDHALEFLDLAPAGQPFLLNVGYVATHSPYAAAAHDPRFTALYQDATFGDIPAYHRHPWAKNEDGPGEPPTQQALRERYIGYYAAVTEIDQEVQRIVDKLDELGRLEQTVIIYTSDHGCTLGHHGFWGKGNSTRPLNMHEHALRIPLIWHGPGITSGHIVDHCVDHYDTFMTILEQAGLRPEPGRHYPGTSYTPLIRGTQMDWDDTRYGEYGDLRMIRTPQWKLVYRYPNGPHDLFDLLHDPDETHNLLAGPTRANLVAELKQRLEMFYEYHQDPDKSGLRVKELPQHNSRSEAWRDGIREGRA